ncbi:MAG: ribosomal L7Ae/L30e/S12e/Gadd45 family protein [Dysosmobacter sp.]|nr:ribosomal L7Ae/L30e/S12e/Gadd45 family protein [Dysosmobacter sp.]
MDSRDNILSLLGLALRGGRLVMGEEPVEGVARARDARVLLLASDAADNTRRRIEHFADEGQCMWLRVPFTKEELGRALGRTSVAVAAITDIGLAAAVARRLAELDPARYGESAARLDVKAQRAAERRAEQLAHEKNLRQGKKRVKKVPPPEEAPPPKTVRSRIAGSPSGSQPKSRPSKGNRPKPRAKPNPYAHSRPVKKGKGSFRKKES